VTVTRNLIAVAGLASVLALAGPTTVAVADGPVPLRFSAQDPAQVFAGEWTPMASDLESRLAGTAVQLTYSGPWISWLTTTGPARGKIDVIIDGQVRDDEMSLYSDVEQPREYRWSTLTLGQNHTIRIIVTGDRDSRSHDSLVVHQGFMALNAPIGPSASAPALPGPAAPGAAPAARPGTTLGEPARFYRASDPLVEYTSTWTDQGDTAAQATLPALPKYRQAESGLAIAAFRFNGPSVTWYTLAGPDRGKVRVSIDDVIRDDDIDLYSPTLEVRSYSWSVVDPQKLHFLRIHVVGDKSRGSTGDRVAILGFSTPGAPAAPAP